MVEEQQSDFQLGADDEQVVKDFSLTNTEFLRLKVTGEWPERVERFLEKKVQHQLKTKDGFNKNVESKNFSKTPELSYEEFKNWMQESLTKIESLLKTEKPNLKEISSIATDVRGMTAGFYFKIYQDQSFLSSYQSLNNDAKLLLEKTLDNKKPEDRVLYINSIFSLEDASFHLPSEKDNDFSALKPKEVLERVIKKEIENEQWGVVGELLNLEDGTQNEAYRILTNEMRRFYFKQDLSPSFNANMVLHLSNPLVNIIKDKIKNQGGYHSAEPALNDFEWLIKRASLPEEREILKTNNFDLQNVADDFVEVLNLHSDSIKEGYPSHGLARKMVDTLTTLYGTDQNVLKVHKDLGTLLGKIHKEKVVAYGQKGGSLDSTIKNLAKYCGVYDSLPS